MGIDLRYLAQVQETTTAGRLAGKVCIVTGAAQGQGSAEARLFAAEGARVVVADVQDELAASVAADIGSAAVPAVLDVRAAESWATVVRETVDRWGRLDVLVNNAAIAEATPFLTATAEDYEAVFRVNELGVFLGIQAAARAMVAGGHGGSIVNISSTEGIEGIAPLAAYSAAKFAVRGLTRTAAIELGPFGIRVNSVHPGWIDTPMITKNGGEMHSTATELLKAEPIPRFGQPEEVAHAALFLASDDSSYCTASEVTVDGGLIAGRWAPLSRDAVTEAGRAFATNTLAGQR